MFEFKKLNVWHRSVEFADRIIYLTESIPGDFKHFRLIEQMEAAVTSVSLNIAEGKGRQYDNEFKQHLFIARGFLYETLTLLNIFARRQLMSREELIELENEGYEIVRMIVALINIIRKR
jgi:four helix bundle protein